MGETLISLVELVGEEKLRTLVEEVSHLSASSIVVLDAGGELLAKAGQLPVECLWGKEDSKIESDSSVIAQCIARNCPFSEGQVCVPINAGAVGREVYRQVYQHSGTAAHHDDITMVVMKVTDGQGGE